MCRMLAIAGKELNAKIGAKALAEFRNLADCGCVPVGLPSGHRDGWGVAAYRNGKPVFHVRKAKDASADADYPKAAKKAALAAPDMVMVHFRKASVGGLGVRNSAPFVDGTAAFAHNGSIFESGNIPLKAASRRALKGETDSEKVFALLRENLKAPRTTLRAAFVKTVRMVKKACDYRAMNFFATDGTTLIVIRDFNPKDAVVKEKNLEDYYTMFVGARKGTKGRIFASEKLPLPGVSWKLLKNRELVAMKI